MASQPAALLVVETFKPIAVVSDLNSGLENTVDLHFLGKSSTDLPLSLSLRKSSRPTRFDRPRIEEDCDPECRPSSALTFHTVTDRHLECLPLITIESEPPEQAPFSLYPTLDYTDAQTFVAHRVTREARRLNACQTRT